MTSKLNLIKDLREKTGSGFLDCKNALKENNNDIEQSIDFLRKKGLLKASKKTSREAKEGVIGFYSNTNLAIIIKINSETDFAAKGDVFLDFVDHLGNLILEINDTDLNKDKFLNSKYENKTILDYFNNMIAKIGENIVLNDLIVVDIKNKYFSFYVHSIYRKNIGKIISFIQYKAKNDDVEMKNFAKNICMHIAASKPESIDIEDLNKDSIDRETNIQKELILSSGKPNNVADKILEGKMKKYFSEVTLMNQKYIMDPEKTVKEIIQSYSNNNFELLKFKLLMLNE